MKVISSTGSPSLKLKNTCVAIGIFDGVHLGHQYLIKKMLSTAARLKCKPVVITFSPHPAEVLKPGIDLKYLTSLQQRLDLLKQLGVKICVVIPFTKSFAQIEPSAFIENFLVKKLDVKAVFVGEDFRFGKNRMGDIVFFKKLAQEHHFEMHAVAPLKKKGAVISSTRIRLLVQEGKTLPAQDLLGRAVSIQGKVVKGSQRGRLLGFPTANIAYIAGLLPLRGVYICKVFLNKKELQAVVNIGIRPSFKDKNPHLHVEAHVLNFNRSIYGRVLQVQFLRRIRNEKSFANPQALIAQIQKDVNQAQNYFKS